MNDYEHTAQSNSDFNKLLYNDEVFLTLAVSNFNWLTDNGFSRYTPSEMKVFSQNPKFYKIEDDCIFFILLRTKDSVTYEVREKYKLLKSEKLIEKLKMNDDIFDNFLEYIQPSLDIKKPTMIMYHSNQLDYTYHDENKNKKKLSYFLNVDRMTLKMSSDNDFYISNVSFELGHLNYIEVMLDGVIRSGEPLRTIWNEMGVTTPTLEDFFNLNVDLTDETKFLFEAVVI